MEINLYIFKSKNLIENPILTDVIKSHTKNYSLELKRKISESNYHNALKVLEQYGGNIDSFRFINGKPIVDDFYMSFSTSNDFYGFTISKLDNGFDLEKIIDEKRKQRLANKILKDDLYNEYINLGNSSEYLTTKWSEFEAEAKMTGKGLDYKFIHKDIIYKSFRLDNTIFVVCANREFKLNVYLDYKRL